MGRSERRPKLGGIAWQSVHTGEENSRRNGAFIFSGWLIAQHWDLAGPHS